MDGMETTTPLLPESRVSGQDELTSLVYVSSATQLFSPEALVDLLECARDKNARLGVTGMLLYKDGNFMQALEGPTQAVQDLYATIVRDPRHHVEAKLLEFSTDERQFANWAMGFTQLAGARPSDGTGYSDILNQPLNAGWFREDPTRAQRLLLSFRKNM
jgi:hypothetical protein